MTSGLGHSGRDKDESQEVPVEVYTQEEAEEEYFKIFNEVQDFYETSESYYSLIGSSPTDFSAYENTKEAEEFFRKCYIKTWFGEVERYPEEAKEEMKALKEGLSDYCLESQFAMKHLLNYLEGEGMEELSNAKTYMQSADGYKVDSLASLFSAALALNIDTNKLEVKE